jgi:acyl-CoA synthetase (AMP-forming)/AMP-acid ligase II
MPNARWGEAGEPQVVLASGAKEGPDDLLAWARPRLASFKVLRHIRIVGGLARNATGKVPKPELRRISGDRE